MRKSRFTEAQIIGILKQAEGGAKVGDLAREHGVSTGTIYNWRAKSGGLEVSEAKRLKELEDENRPEEACRRPVLGQGGAQICAWKKVVSPTAKRAVVEHFEDDFELSERRACRLVGQPRSTQRHRSQKAEIPGLRKRLLEHAAERPRFGYRRLTILVRRDGFKVNHKRVYRIYKEHNLTVKRRRRNRASQAPREAFPAAEQLNDCWSMDFLTDSLSDGRSMRVFAALDHFSRRSVALEFDVAMPAERVTRMLDEAIEAYGKPRRIRSDNGPEFTSKAFDTLAYERGMEHHFIRPGKPVENALAESLNGRIRDEFLNQHCFRSIRHARDLGADWLNDYNRVRPHSAHDGLSPEQFLAELRGPLGDDAAPHAPNSPTSTTTQASA